MKKIALFLMIILLSGCAQHDEDGNIMYDDEGNEQIDGWKTAGLVAGIAVATTGVVLMARNSHKWNTNGGGYYSQPQNNTSDNYSGNCLCPSDVDASGRTCGERSSYSRPGGQKPTAEFCQMRAINNIKISN